MIYTLDDIKKKIIPIAKKYNIQAVWVFGSYARGEATEHSDVDLLFQRKGSDIVGWMIGGFYEDLCETLGKDLDLVTIETLEQPYTISRTPWFVDNLLKERRLLYAEQ
jgi:predicted nucleotidyltransferase